MKRIISFIVALTMIITMTGTVALANVNPTENLSTYITYLSPSLGDSSTHTVEISNFTMNNSGSLLTENDTYIPAKTYYATGSFYGSGNITTTYMSVNSAADPKAVLYADKNSIGETTVTENDRIHFSAYLNLVSGKITGAEVYMSAAGVPISVDVLDGYLNTHMREWVKLDVFYQPKITYTYTKTDKSTSEAVTGLTYSTTSYINGNSTSDVTEGTVLAGMPGYDAEKYSYTVTDVEYGKLSSYINGNVLKSDVSSTAANTDKNPYEYLYSYCNLPNRIAFRTNGVAEGVENTALYVSKATVNVVYGFNEKTFPFVQYPVLEKGDNYDMDGSDIIIGEHGTMVSNIAVPQGCSINAYSSDDAAFSAPKASNYNISVGDKVVLRDSTGLNLVYYTVAAEGRSYNYGPVIDGTELYGIKAATISATDGVVAGKAAPALKLTANADANDMYFAVPYSTSTNEVLLPSYSTPKYVVLEFSYMPTTDDNFYIAGEQSVPFNDNKGENMINKWFALNRWNKVTMVWKNGSTPENPNPGQTIYDTRDAAKAASPHTYELYINGELKETGANKAFGMRYLDSTSNTRTDKSFRIVCIPISAAGKTVYVDDVKLYETNIYDAASYTSMPALSGIDGVSVSGNTAILYDDSSVSVESVLQKPGTTVYKDENLSDTVTSGELSVGNVIAYSDEEKLTGVSYYTVDESADAHLIDIDNYSSDISVCSGTSSSTAGISEVSTDTAFELYSTDTKGHNVYLETEQKYTTSYFANRTYSVFEADIKFGENGSHFYFATDNHAKVSEPISSDSVLIKKDAWNKLVTIVDYATGASKTYVNGIFYEELQSPLYKNMTVDGAIRLVAYDAGETSSSVPVVSVDNIKVYGTFTPPVYDAAVKMAEATDSFITFVASDSVKTLDKYCLFAAAFDSTGKLIGDVQIGETGTVTIDKVENAEKYICYVLGDENEIAPISGSIEVKAN